MTRDQLVMQHLSGPFLLRWDGVLLGRYPTGVFRCWFDLHWIETRRRRRRRRRRNRLVRSRLTSKRRQINLWVTSELISKNGWAVAADVHRLVYGLVSSSVHLFFDSESIDEWYQWLSVLLLTWNSILKRIVVVVVVVEFIMKLCCWLLTKDYHHQVNVHIQKCFYYTSMCIYYSNSNNSVTNSTELEWNNECIDDNRIGMNVV